MSIIEQAKEELLRIDFGPEDTEVMIELLTKFFDQWDSGGAVWAVAPILSRLLAGKPLSPITGDEDEWFIHGFDDRMWAQNKRHGSLFMRRDGTCYDIDAKDPHANVTFPYYPEGSDIPAPVIEVGSDV